MRTLNLKREPLASLGEDELRIVVGGSTEPLDSTCLCNSVWIINDITDIKIKTTTS